MATRGQLLEAALECLIERGYAGTTLAEVTARAGLSNGALWKHFPTKAQLMGDVGLLCSSRLVPLDPGPRGGSPEKRVRAAVAAL